ncbi:hypothetical protein NIES4071_108400 (plasmid) [Calothrix sp. NIES-4071]|nr:hypothetical protein NIES4071_108400 [Calothrix sp. NIES-4071]BAZ65149.1 hypothetical protein NIES4105_108820 [Calothrix sp. NIES-4105]
MSETTQHPNNLTGAEYHELAVQSAIHPALIALNFLHLTGEAGYDYLFTINVPRKNAGRVTDGFLKRYKHIELGGLWISGLDPQDNWVPSDWGRFKPTYPRINSKGKLIKYESQPGVSNRVTYFDIPQCIWDLVAQRYGIKRYHSSLARRLSDKFDALVFWEWVKKHPEIPIILCEGEKKAACLLSMGFVAIALPGIWNGRVGKKDFDERLHPDLIPMCQKGRQFIILFDYESKQNTRWSVYQATLRTGEAIEATGCTCEVALLPGPEKGVDDFVVARAANEDANKLLTSIIDDAKSLKDYRYWFFRKKRGLSQLYPADITVNVKYLTEALGFEADAEWETQGSSDTLTCFYSEDEEMYSDTPPIPHSNASNKPKFLLPTKGLVALWSDMGTAKTELMRFFRQLYPSVRFLNNGHRVNLLKNLARRLNTEMYSALKYGDLAKVEALSITIDSLHKLNTQSLKYGCIFIDEACQYLNHLLHSKTCREYRAQILEVLHYIVYNARLVVIADAHMDDVTMNFFAAMRPEGEKPCIVLNEYKNGGRPIYWYEGKNPSALVARIAASIMLGKKVMVVSDSKRFIKKLEILLTKQKIKCEESGVTSDMDTSDNGANTLEANGIKIWSIHSDNSGSEENVAFIEDISNAVKNVEVLLTSPSLGTGVDIPEYHFDAVFGIFHASSQTATECAQQLYRYRPIVPIYVWVASCPLFGYRQTNATKIRKQLLETNEITAFLIKIDRETGKRGVEKDYALEAHCQLLAQRNESINNLRADLRDLLKGMGNQIIPVGEKEDIIAQNHLKAAGETLDQAHYFAVSSSENISVNEYKSRQNKDYLSPEEKNECEKFRIADSYGMEVTPELVREDNGGILIKSIIALEGLLTKSPETIIEPNTGAAYPLPPEIVASRDRLERMHSPVCFDWKNHSVDWLAMHLLGLPNIVERLVDGGEITAADLELAQMVHIAKKNAAYIKSILGFTVPEKFTPIWLLGSLLDLLGLKLDNHKVGPKGKQVKYFFLNKEKLEFALSVIKYREHKRALKEEHARQAAEDQARYEAGIKKQYGIKPPSKSVFTPPPNCKGKPPMGGENTNDDPIEEEVGEGWEPNDGDSTPIKTSLRILLSAIARGIEVVKALFRSWTETRRWCVVMVLEEFAPQYLRQLEQLIPNFYDWLSVGL